KVKGNRLIVTTSTANKLIADVWFARADFAKDNPEIVEGLALGIFDAMQDLKAQDAKQKVAKLMAAGYSIPESDALGMLGDAHSTNYAENRDFFLNKKVTRAADGKDVEELYDPNVGFVVEEIGKLAGQYGAARIVIEGHTDGSMKTSVPKSLVQELSLNRANSVKEAILRKFPSLQPNQFSTAGLGWDRPADPSDPENNAKNRRLDVKVYPAEATAAPK